MEISVIIPTYNGGNKLNNILDALEHQSITGFEVLVAIDGSKDQTISILKNRQPVNYSLRYCYQENKGRASVRNFGAKQVKGGILVFFDDDIRPEPNCLFQHLIHHKNYSGSLAAGKPLEDEQVMKSDVQRYKRYLSLKWYQPLKQVFLQKQESLFFTAANCSVAAKDFWELKGFNESLRDAEDYDLGRRALLAGKKVYFLNQAVGYHDDFISARSYVNRLRQYREAHKILAEIYPENGCREVRPGFLKKLVYRSFSFPFWLSLIDRELLLWLPVKLRYKTYDLIFTSLSEYYFKVPIR